MCGFAGFLQPSTAIDHDRSMRIVRAMAAPIDHRGPDSEGALVDAGRGLALAFRRLAIMDLSEAGHQPMVSRTGRLTIVFNGEIYNSAELRERVEAKGIALRGHSDTEAMVEHMALFGIEKTIGDLVGMFAIAVFDRDDGRLVLVLAAGALIGVATGSAVGRIAGERRLQQSFAGLLVVVAAVTAAHQVGAGM